MQLLSTTLGQRAHDEIAERNQPVAQEADIPIRSGRLAATVAENLDHLRAVLSSECLGIGDEQMTIEPDGIADCPRCRANRSAHDAPSIPAAPPAPGSS